MDQFKTISKFTFAAVTAIYQCWHLSEHSHWL